MNIYFVGAHSTGKTSLFNEVLRLYPGMAHQPEIPRSEIIRNRINLDDLRKKPKLLEDFQYDILNKQIAAEKSTEAMRGSWREICNEEYSCLFDRSAFDIMAYIVEHLQPKDFFTKSEITSYVDFIKDLLKNQKALLFFLRPNSALVENDGVRETTDLVSVHRIDSILKTILNFYSIPYISIDAINFSDRINSVTTIINTIYGIHIHSNAG